MLFHLFQPDQIDAFYAAAAAEAAKYVPDSGSTILQESLPVFSHKTIETILSTGFQVPETEEKWHIDLKPCSETPGETDLNENQDKSVNIAEPKQTLNENDCETSDNVLTPSETEVDALLSMGSSKTGIFLSSSLYWFLSLFCFQLVEVVLLCSFSFYLTAQHLLRQVFSYMISN